MAATINITAPVVESVDIPHLDLENAGYTFTKDIAQIGQGVIKLATHANTGSTRCVKCYDKSKLGADALELLRSEIDLIFDLGKHPNIGEAFEVFQDPGSYYLAQPFYSGGDLVGVKRRAVGAGVVPTESWWTSIIRQCLEGLAHMHARGVMHCDIKEANIMLKSDDLQEPEVVIIDLGVAQVAGTNRDIIHGTPGYIPPEVWEAKNWHPQSDMFSFGVVVVQMLICKMGIFTENARTYKDIKEATLRRPPPLELMPIEFPRFRGLAQKLLAKDFRDRPTAASMLQQVWEEDFSEDSDDDAAFGLKTHQHHTHRRHSAPISTPVARPHQQSSLGNSPAAPQDMHAYHIGVHTPHTVAVRRISFSA